MYALKCFDLHMETQQTTGFEDILKNFGNFKILPTFPKISKNLHTITYLSNTFLQALEQLI